MTEAAHAPRGSAVKRIGLAIATTLVSINIWTGCPLLAVWVGSRTAGESQLSMRAVFVVVLVLAVSALCLTLVLGWLSERYDAVTGRPAGQRRTSPWLRSMRGEREDVARRNRGISGVERIVVISVVACVITFEIWFFFFAGSPLPK